MPARLLPVTPPELVVLDQEEPCSYLPGRQARRPLRLPARPLTPPELDQRLAAGDRRAGLMLYNQECPSCAACEALRVDVAAFVPSRSQRRAQAKGDAVVTVTVGRIEVDDARIELYRAHQSGRKLDQDGRPPLESAEYESYFAASCAEGLDCICAQPPCDLGSCQQTRTVGQSCNDTTEVCGTDLACTAGVCVASGAADQSLPAGTHCARGTAYGRQDSPCAAGLECLCATADCAQPVCAQPRNLAESCDGQSQICRQGLICSAGLCADAPPRNLDALSCPAKPL